MPDILISEIPEASTFAAGINQIYDNPLPPILATEVFAELAKRCANGMQYTTFPNTISDEEKAKLEDAGYIVTRNTVPSDPRYGQGDLYIGFQVALTSRASEEAMQITDNSGS